jgi:hypothetical protein
MEKMVMHLHGGGLNDIIRRGTLSQSGTLITATAPVFDPSDVDPLGYNQRFIITSPDGYQVTIASYVSPTQVHASTYTQRNVSNMSFRLLSGSSGWQALDTAVLGTTIRKGNYNYGSSSMQQLANGETLPSSLYLTSKPAWFGNLNWPPIDPANPPAAPQTYGASNPVNNIIPAAYRFNNNQVNPPGVP